MTSGTSAGLHLAAAVVGFLAAAAGGWAGRRHGRAERTAHAVMTAAMLAGLLAAAGVAVPFAVLPLLVLAAWGTAWGTAWAAVGAAPAADRRTPLAVDLLATAALLLLLPAGTGHGGLPAGDHLHRSGSGLTAVLALAVSCGWLAAAVLRCRAAGPRLPSVCAAGMAGSMVVMAAAGF
ncbi:hypothetical protein [Kineococcus sp. SYSU DK002]|uniref:hypothetical protein n=1 Tax=Kineococcus sp. SYSU DK002 TaxID=3383123 RepID=UPI003D7DDA03